jgi:nucleotide-binding universal stress UspA family protein
MKIKNVLVPTDFSVPSKMAVNYGVALARKFRAKLRLVHVLGLTPPAETADIDGKMEQHLRDRALKELSTLVSSEDEDDLDLQIDVRLGSVHQAIADAINEQRSDLIVLGTHGRGRLERMILGSTTEGLIRKLPIPALTVRTTGPMDFKHIVFATDLSESSAQGFDFALDLAQSFESAIVAVHALDKKMVEALEDNAVVESRQRAFREASRKLAQLATEGQRKGVRVETLLVEGEPALEVLKTAEAYNADLILLAISKKEAWNRALFGATAEQVVRKSNIPVLCIPVHVEA